MCPVCGEPLIALELEGVEIDHCLSCRGTWLDEGELEQIAELADVPAGPLAAALETVGGEKHGTRRCPRCNRRLTLVNVGSNPAIELDHCPRGHGLWFDAGEMVTLIASFSEGETGAVASLFGDLLRHELDSGSKGV